MNSKVWIVYGSVDYEEGTIIGVFTTEAIAQAVVDTFYNEKTGRFTHDKFDHYFDDVCQFDMNLNIVHPI